VQLIGVDTGGTFTDAVVVAADGRLASGKTLSTPGDLSTGVIRAIGNAAERLGLAATDVLEATDVISHGTTVGLNALLTKSGARVGMLVTSGFEATLPIAKANKVIGLPDEFFNQPTAWSKPELLVTRSLIRGVTERVDVVGDVITPLDENAARVTIEQLVAAGVTAFGVCLLWATANPVHERTLARLIREQSPGAHVSLSSDLARRIGEFERMSTVAVNAYVAPLVSTYLAELESKLQDAGFRGLFLIAKMGGGVSQAEHIKRAPVHTLHSGPVGGITASSKLGELLGHRNVITTDVGGTSFDVGLINNGRIEHATRPMVERHALAVPMVNVAAIGTGGGSIASVDEFLGALRVGPTSAGADPGPACYGRGGILPTVTDAAVVLGYLERLGGSLVLDVKAAHAAIEREIAIPLGMDVYDAASGILRVANSQMADLVRRTTVQRGYDPADFALYGYGGAAPQYVGAYARPLGVRTVLVPRLASAFSAHGAISSDLLSLMEQDLLPGPFGDVLPTVERLFTDLEDLVTRELQGAADDLGKRVQSSVTLRRFVGLRFYRQVHRIDVELTGGIVDRLASDVAEATFRKRYEEIIGRGSSFADTPIELCSLRAEGRVTVPLPLPHQATGSGVIPTHSRRARFDSMWSECPVFTWDSLAAGARVDGPAFIESEHTTLVVYPGQDAVADRYGNVELIMNAGRP
jgi:N-methylhydantoinase A